MMVRTCVINILCYVILSQVIRHCIQMCLFFNILSLHGFQNRIFYDRHRPRVHLPDRSRMQVTLQLKDFS